MGKYIVKRMLVMIPVLLGMILVLFFMLNVVPGDPVTVMMKEHLKADVIDNLRESMHLDDPFFVRYLRYVGDALRGDLGTSWKLNRPVTAVIAQAFPYTFRLAVSAALLSWITGIPIGIISAVKKNTKGRSINYDHRQIMDLLESARVMVDFDARMAASQAIDNAVVHEDAITLPLYQRNHLFCLNPRVQGFKVDWNGWSDMSFYGVSLTN